MILPPTGGHPRRFTGDSIPMRGLGDAVALVAQPIAIAIDRATSVLPKRLRTNIAGCGGCQKRKAALNKAVPFKT